PTSPPMRPRWCGGTWSGSTAVIAASSAWMPSCVTAHPTTSTGIDGATATRQSPTAPAAVPPSIHGLRMPNRERVRSDSRPNSGFPMIPNTAPTAATRDSDPLAPSGSISRTRSASVIAAGVRIADQAHRLASTNATRASGRRPGPASVGGAPGAAGLAAEGTAPEGTAGSTVCSTAGRRAGRAGPLRGEGDGRSDGQVEQADRDAFEELALLARVERELVLV